MPEGDTVWLTAQRLHAALAGATVTTFDLRVPQLAVVDLRGDVVEAVIARGKHLLMRFASGVTLHNHLRMDGSWRIARAGSRAIGPRHDEHQIRALVGNSAWLATGIRVHDLRLVAAAAERELVGHLGPDLLGPDWNAAHAIERLSANPERAIGEALLDQRNLAGIGNLYKAETLFIAGAHPWTPTAAVTDLARLIETAHRLLLRNRDRPEQSTTGSLARGAQHWVYLRAGEPCRRCATPIERARQGRPPQDRETWWCPRCQPAPAAAAG